MPNGGKPLKNHLITATASLFCFAHPTHGFNMVVVTGRCKQSINGPLFQNPESEPAHFKGPWAAEICEVQATLVFRPAQQMIWLLVCPLSPMCGGGSLCFPSKDDILRI